MAARRRRRATTDDVGDRPGLNTLSRAAMATIIAAAVVLLFWRLGAIYLWQDEANTAVLAVRLLKFGKPLAYDGVNLLTNDSFAAEDQHSISERTATAAAAVQYITRRGDVKDDTSWVFHPWGQFITAAASIGVLGPTTIAARLPFAVAALAAVAVLFWLASRTTGSLHIGALACALLLLNPYWILHSRQARYYALSSLCLLLTLLAYERWQSGSRWGAATFAVAAWLWFQVDYGTWWPVVGVLFTHAMIANWDQARKVLVPGAILAVSIVPFLFFYEIWNRRSVQLDHWALRFGGNLFNVDRFVIPMVVLAAALLLFVRRTSRYAAPERRLVVISLAILVALLLWVPTVTPVAFLRYVIIAAPVGAFVSAWFLYRAFESAPRGARWVAAAVVALTPWLSKPFDFLAPAIELRTGRAVVRPELHMMFREIFVPRPDPNRLVVEWLKGQSTPADEILINYEDLPLMYYLPNPIRGGVAAFRVEDPSRPPAFIVLRKSVEFVHWPVFSREFDRHEWQPVSTGAPDVIWGNNPDPWAKIPQSGSVPEVFVARRTGPRKVE